MDFPILQPMDTSVQDTQRFHGASFRVCHRLSIILEVEMQRPEMLKRVAWCYIHVSIEETKFGFIHTLQPKFHTFSQHNC